MSDNNNDNKDVRGQERAAGDSSTTTTTVEERSTEAEPRPASAELTPEEEKVIRMLHGRSLEGHEVLEFAPGATMETRLKLGLIEAHLLETFEAEPVETDPETGAPRSVIADDLGG